MLTIYWVHDITLFVRKLKLKYNITIQYNIAY